jgi:putative hemolysin
MNALRVSRSRLALSVTSLPILLAAAPPALASVTYDLDAAQDYCVSVGGEVQERQAMWHTNSDPSQWVDLGRTLEVCRFQADDDAGSRIYVDLLTLWSEAPSLAAAAYLAKMPMSDELPPGNPATYHCADLGGSSQWGSGAAGGGWVNMDDPVDPVVAMCVFPDGSAIDDWGLAYYSGGAVRGADLAPLFRVDTSAFPLIFG